METKRLFGTDGIRGLIESDPRITIESLIQFARAFAQWVIKKHKNDDGHIVVYMSHDGRQASDEISQYISYGLRHYNGHLSHHYPLFMNPTPVLQNIVCKNSIHGPTYGIMITASHNTAEYQGIKILTPYGKMTQKEEREFEVIYQKEGLYLDYTPKPMVVSGMANIELDYESKTIPSLFPENFLDGVTVALDCAHGAWSELAPSIMENFGATVHTTGCSPDGTNINQNCGSTHPEHIAAFVKEKKADIGFAFDGDGDRVICATRSGDILSGDQIIAYIAPTLSPKSRGIVGTIMSNNALEKSIIESGRGFERVSVGDRNVSEKLREKKWYLGGEPSGHIIYRPFLPSSDGLFTALSVLQIALEKDDIDLTQRIPLLPTATRKCPAHKKISLTAGSFADYIKTLKKQQTTGRSVIRYSGTEPILRIMVEDVSQTDAESYADEIARAYDRAVKDITHI